MMTQPHTAHSVIAWESRPMTRHLRLITPSLRLQGQSLRVRLMVNSFGFERGIPREKDSCSRCESRDAMDGSDYCRSCLEWLSSLTA